MILHCSICFSTSLLLLTPWITDPCLKIICSHLLFFSSFLLAFFPPFLLVCTRHHVSLEVGRELQKSVWEIQGCRRPLILLRRQIPPYQYSVESAGASIIQTVTLTGFSMLVLTFRGCPQVKPVLVKTPLMWRVGEGRVERTLSILRQCKIQSPAVYWSKWELIYVHLFPTLCLALSN